ncbi:MAG: PRC-barrel domain-containing protein [Thermoplasmataceae archaeon]|nr:PRC-barrel domain-containing protein [Candidatus Thermoplasmatota archaeon]
MVDLKKFTTDIIGKSVVTTTGQVVGKLDNLVLNLDTGEVTNLLVEPTEDAVIQTLERDKEGRYVVSIKGIKSMEDVLVVDLSQSKHI